MKWYHSLKFKNLLFFLSIGALFLLAMFLFFTDLREHRLVEKAKPAVTIATDAVVKELLLTQQRYEQIVEDMADVTSVLKGHPDVIKRLLSIRNNSEIVSGGLWFEPYAEASHIETLDCFYHRDSKGEFVKIADYASKIEGSYRSMEYYVLAKQLKAGETFWTKAYIDPVTKIRMITVVSPIYRNEKFVGVASLDVKLSLGKQSIFSELIASDERYFVLTDRVGELLIYSDELSALGLSEETLDSNETSGVERLVTNFLFYQTPQTDNSALANKLLKASPDFSAKEARVLAGELKHKNSHHREKLLFDTKIINDDPIFHEPTVVAMFYFPHTGWHMLIAIPEHVILKDTFVVYNKIMMITAIFAIIATLLGYLLIRQSIVKPLESISEQVERNDPKEALTTEDRGEIGTLVSRFNQRNHELLDAREHELQNERLLLQQSKMAAMGEMLDAVAHQWKQPLNALSMYTELIKLDYEGGEVDQAYIEQFQKDVETQINHMTETLGTFRSFFRPSTSLGYFDLQKVVDDVLLLAKDELLKNTIEVSIEEQAHLQLFGSDNEFKHLLLNIINNAKDAFNDNDIKKRHITIRLISEGDARCLEIEDSAGGMPQEVLENVFKAHFTTKEEGKGTGIGLYMSTQIAEKHHAKLSVENREAGACFIVTFSNGSFTA